jgi:thiol-disulfide isomerase/thioredoxin
VLLAQNEATKARIEANEKNNLFNIRTIPESLTGTDIFKAIVKDYKGKKVLVDFWATWCGPCRQAMQTILPVKEELWGKVAFVYVTGETSPKALWNKMAPDIHGDHYYVTAAQWDTLLKQFGVQGIPAYVVVGADNEVITKHIGYPGNDVIKEELK